ncbi:hypothetical protein [Runella salmonicolor]|uniref:Uncharacterized protein n=1 Tax=Runella salmonicolor TaxID=2950278 RepID=A0ABT1G1G8_9BACT|nr:hypothetical protein [Runella salmonicolor]MCP1386567.1 hypothetical protein [Runella salmonicolor]
MKRRFFISSTLSAMSLTLIDSSLVQATEKTKNLDKRLLERLVEAFEFKVSDACWSDPVFMKVFEETSLNFLKSNYQLSQTRAFQLAPFNLVLVPMQLKVASLGCIDWAFVFYEQLQDKQWKHVKSINAYEADTILKSADAIAKQLPEGQLPDFLLPVYVSKKKSVSFATRKGHVDIKIILEQTGFQSNIQICNQSEILFQETYHLSHALQMAV